MSGNGADQLDPKTPAIALSYIAKIEATDLVPTVQFETGLVRDCSQEEIDDLLDKFRLALTRQKRLRSIEGKRVDIENHKLEIMRIQKQIADEDAEQDKRAAAHKERGARTELGLTAAQNKARFEMLRSIEQHSFAITTQTSIIAALEKDCGICPSPANS